MACFINGIDPNPPDLGLRNSAPPLRNPMMEGNYPIGKVVPVRLANTVVEKRHHDVSIYDSSSQQTIQPKIDTVEEE